MFRVIPASSILVAVAVAGASAAGAKDAAPHQRLLCRSYQHVTTASGRGPRYVIRNDNYGHQPECVGVTGRPGFVVVRSGAHATTAEPVAYPDIFLGCSWGVCSPRSGLPIRIARLRSLVTSWSTRLRAAGQWSAGYDLWFARTPSTSGQSTGAEVMIWLNSRGFAANRWPIVVIDHKRWHLAHWVTGHRGKEWTYVQFRSVVRRTRVSNLDARPFILAAERAGLVSRSWWLASVEAGFEIWRGGVGLRTTWFAVRPRT